MTGGDSTIPRLDPPHPTPAAPTTGHDESAATAPQLRLAQFLDAEHLLDLQQSLTRMTGLSMTILDEQGHPLASPSSPSDRRPDLSSPASDQNSEFDIKRNDQGHYVAPIIVEGQQLGSITIDRLPHVALMRPPSDPFRQQARQFGLAAGQIETLLDSVDQLLAPGHEAAAQFLYLWTNSITQLCYRGYQLRQRVSELSTLYKVSRLLTAHRDLQQVLDDAARSAAQVMGVKAASIRLLDADRRQLVAKAVFNLSKKYLEKGPVRADQSELYRRNLAGEVVYVENMAEDPRVLYPDDARREGLMSMLGAPMISQGRPIGVIRLYTRRRRTFSSHEADMLQAVAGLLATAIEDASLHAEHVENERVQRQLRMAADVQKRMMPSEPPHVPPFEIAARYVPCFELGGDFYDFVPLDGHLGIVVGDVVGKGVPASLLMASVRASLRAYAQDVYDLAEIISRVNRTMTRDTLDNEFVTLFYGVIDPPKRRLTYCNAGHEPPLLLRDGRIIRLEVGGMTVGVDAPQRYEKAVVDMKPNDLLVIYTDGLTDALSFSGDRFRRSRIIEAMEEAAGGSAQDVLNHVLWQMRRFVGLNRSVDDTTIVTVKVG